MRRSGESLLADARLHRRDKPVEPHRGQFAQQAREVAEMVLGRRMRHASFARRRTQRQPLDAFALENALRGLQQRLFQRAVMIGLRPFGLAYPARRRPRGCTRPALPNCYPHAPPPLPHIDAVNILS